MRHRLTLLSYSLTIGHEKKIKRTTKKESPKGKVKVMLGTGTVEHFFERSRERARKLGRGEKLTPEIRPLRTRLTCFECFQRREFGCSKLFG